MNGKTIAIVVIILVVGAIGIYLIKKAKDESTDDVQDGVRIDENLSTPLTKIGVRTEANGNVTYCTLKRKRRYTDGECNAQCFSNEFIPLLGIGFRLECNKKCKTKFIWVCE